MKFSSRAASEPIPWSEESGWVPAWAQQAEFWQAVTAAGLALFLLGVLVSFFLVPRFLRSIPSDYFIRRELKPVTGQNRRFIRALRNFAGLLLMMLGVLLLVLPGPGYLTILIGLVVSDFAWKYRFGRWVLRRRGLRSAVDRLRERAGMAPLMLERPEK